MNTGRIIDAMVALSVAGAATAAWVIWTTPVFAHDWYPLACCNDRDCFEVTADQLVPTADGWRYVITGEVIPYNRVRQTPAEAGNTFHICTYGGNPASPIIGSTRETGACVWTPQLGS